LGYPLSARRDSGCATERTRRKEADRLRDTDATQANYVAASRGSGVKRNRKRVLVVREEIVAISRLDDVVDE
jgi:hypothetical protein